MVVVCGDAAFLSPKVICVTYLLQTVSFRIVAVVVQELVFSSYSIARLVISCRACCPRTNDLRGSQFLLLGPHQRRVLP